MPRPSTSTKLARLLGARLRALRAEAGLTQEKLAWDCDISKPYLSQVEAGQRQPSLAVLRALAERLGLSLLDVVAVDAEDPVAQLVEAARKKDRAAVRRALRQLGLA